MRPSLWARVVVLYTLNGATQMALCSPSTVTVDPLDWLESHDEPMKSSLSLCLCKPKLSGTGYGTLTTSPGSTEEQSSCFSGNPFVIMNIKWRTNEKKALCRLSTCKI